MRSPQASIGSGFGAQTTAREALGDRRLDDSIAARGLESQLATNHCGHFQLTARLWPALRRADGARVVSLSSRGHRRSGVDFDDPNFERRPYDKWVAYGQSKTANALFAIALDARGEADRIRAFSVHPGAIVTDLMRFMPEEDGRMTPRWPNGYGR
jgi:NAD(P)-dependent dehydrogenase (short-subunit alcohol dehydrogenase family)